MTVDRAPVDPQALRHPLERARAGAEQRHHHRRGPAPPFGCVRRGLGFEHLPRELRNPGIGVRIGHFEVAAGADDAVEVVAELDIAAEYPIVDPALPGASCAKYRRRGRHWAPRNVLSVRYATPRASSVDWRTEPACADDQLLTQHHDVADLLAGEKERFVQLPAVADERRRAPGVASAARAGAARAARGRTGAALPPSAVQSPRCRSWHAEASSSRAHGVERHLRLGLFPGSVAAGRIH